MYEKERRAVAAMGRQLLASGLTAGTWGNISLKISDDAILITPSGLGYDQQQPQDIVLLNGEGEMIEGKRLPSSEKALHIAIYKACPQARAVIHTRGVYSGAFAAAHKKIPALTEDLAQVIGGAVDCAVYAPPGTEELADAAVKALGERRAVLLSNHGAAVWGASLEQAFMAAQLIEKAAHIAILAELLGGGKKLTAAQTKAMHIFYEEHYSKRQEGEE